MMTTMIIWYQAAVQRQLLVLCETAVIYHKKMKTTAFLKEKWPVTSK